MVHLRHRNLLQTMAATIFPPFYRHRAARQQYFRLFIVTARRGNDIFAVLSSSRSAGTILLPFYRRRAAREQYFRVLSSPCGAGTRFLCFIVAVQRGNNIFAFYRHRAARKQYFRVLSSPCSAGTIFLPFYRHRAARKRYFRRFSACSAPQIHSRTVLAFAGQLRAFRNVARTARGWRRASCRGENEKQPFEIE